MWKPINQIGCIPIETIKTLVRPKLYFRMQRNVIGGLVF